MAQETIIQYQLFIGTAEETKNYVESLPAAGFSVRQMFQEPRDGKPPRYVVFVQQTLKAAIGLVKRRGEVG